MLPIVLVLVCLAQICPLFLWKRLHNCPQAPQWAETVFGGAEVFHEFLEVHSSPGQWTDELGIMCQVRCRLRSPG